MNQSPELIWLRPSSIIALRPRRAVWIRLASGGGRPGSAAARGGEHPAPDPPSGPWSALFLTELLGAREGRCPLPVPAHSTPGVCSHLPRPTRLHLGCFQNPPHPPNPVAVSHFTWWWMIIFFCDDGLFFFFIIIFFWSFVSLLSLPSLCFAASPLPLSSALSLHPPAFTLPLPALPSHPVVSESRGEGSAASSSSLLPGGGWS